MIGTLINAGAVAAGSLLGRALGARFPQRMQETTLAGIGLMTLFFGVQNALQSHSALVVLGSLLGGGIAGELLDIDGAINRLGAWTERRLNRGQSGTFSKGFVTASLLFCVGPMAVLGCFEDATTGTYRILAVKSLLDGVMSAAFATTLGWGVLLSAASVLVVQGTLTLGAGVLKPLLSPTMVTELTATGGVMLIGLALNLLGLKQIRAANFLPALLLAPLLAHSVRS